MRVGYCILFLICLGGFQAEDDVDGFFKLVVEHNIGENANDLYSRRGIISINSLKSGRGEMQMDVPLSSESLRKLKELSEANGFYHIRVAKMSPGDPSPNYVHSFVRACSLLEAELRDKITIHLDTYGSLLGASLSTDVAHCSPGQRKAASDADGFDTKVVVSQPEVGPGPETELYIRKVEHEKQQAKGQQVDNRSFFVKYWMYIVPVFIFMMVLNHADPNAGAGGGNGGGR